MSSSKTVFGPESGARPRLESERLMATWTQDAIKNFFLSNQLEST